MVLTFKYLHLDNLLLFHLYKVGKVGDYCEKVEGTVKMQRSFHEGLFEGSAKVTLPKNQHVNVHFSPLL